MMPTNSPPMARGTSRVTPSTAPVMGGRDTNHAAMIPSDLTGRPPLRGPRTGGRRPRPTRQHPRSEAPFRPVITHAPHDLSALDDARLAAALATGAGEVLLGLRLQADADRRDGEPPTPAPRTSAGRATPPPRPGSPRPSPAPGPATRCCPRRPPTTPPADRRRASGSSTRSTARASSASTARTAAGATTSPCTSPCGAATPG